MIKIYRENNNIDKLIPYNILIDGNELMTINNDESKTIKLRSNSYNIQVISNTYKSNIINFKVQSNSDITFICCINHHNNFISRFIHKIILKDGIVLKIKK